MEVDDITGASSWSGVSMHSEHSRNQHPLHVHQGATSSIAVSDQMAVVSSTKSQSPTRDRDFHEELAQLIADMCSKDPKLGATAEELAEAFRDASDFPPVTRQSLCELDIQSIISNIRLRHDVNFDRDLSFRPNLDGAKGQEKSRAARKYWTALVAELILYERLYQGSQPLRDADREQVTHHAQRRIPILFQTVRDVLKSLVPDRDHSRVDEHLDIPLLMQAIGRGVCDLVRLAEWMAQLLKEHCAPMRDVWVDSMVESIRNGVARRSPDKLVEGLRGLLGILEAMKLDVANHQIRNLKTLLVEDTINFEKHYHLDRLVHGRPRVDINAAQTWYANATEEFRMQCNAQSRNLREFQLEVFVRATTAVLFGRHGRVAFPDTLYLDQERLRSLKAETDDLICFDTCMELFATVVKQLGHAGSISLTAGQRLRLSISAIMAEHLGHGPQQWMANSEDLSLEILRQASDLTGQSQAARFDLLPEINQHFRHLLLHQFEHQGLILEDTLLPQILAASQRHMMSSPMDIFGNLVSNSPSIAAPPAYVSPLNTSDTFPSAHLHPEAAKLNDLANRITHIIVLHWRVWERIAYVPEEVTHEPSPALHPGSDTTKTSLPRAHSVQTSTGYEQEAHLVTSMKTGDAPEAGTEAHIARQTSSQ